MRLGNRFRVYYMLNGSSIAVLSSRQRSHLESRLSREKTGRSEINHKHASTTVSDVDAPKRRFMLMLIEMLVSCGPLRVRTHDTWAAWQPQILSRHQVGSASCAARLRWDHPMAPCLTLYLIQGLQALFPPFLTLTLCAISNYPITVNPKPSALNSLTQSGVLKLNGTSWRLPWAGHVGADSFFFFFVCVCVHVCVM